MPMLLYGSDGAIITSGISGKSRRLDVSARSDLRTYYTSRDDGQVYTWTGLYAVGANDTVLLVKNISTSLVLIVTEIEIVNDAVTRVRIHLPTVEVTPAGTEIIGKNINTGTTNAADAIARQDDTANSLGDVILDTLIGANEPHPEGFEHGLRITQNKSVAVDFVTAAVALGGATVHGYFEIPGV